MEERQREREKQKLLNMSIDYSSYSPISSFDKPTNFSRPNQNSAFDGLYVPYGSNVWDDPWAIKREKQEIHELPTIQPELSKQPSQPINPFATEVAPSLVFPYDTQQVSPASILSDQPSPTPSLMMSDSPSEEDEMMIQAHKRQRGEHHTIYVQQPPQDQDMISEVTPYTQPTLLTQSSQTGFVDFTANVNPQPIILNPSYNHININNNNNNSNDSYLFTPMLAPFTLEPRPVALPPLAPISIPESAFAASAPAPSSSRRSSMYDSDGEEDVKRKRKSPSTNKRNRSLPVATHVIENTGAPVKMAKFLHVDGLTTRVWIEHAIFTENGISTDIRMIMYQGLFNGVVVHAGDVGERIVCNRRSNISREFGQYTSPTEKILVRVPSEHRPLGQTGNVLTAHGLIRFLQSKKMRKNEHQVYRKWLLHTVYSIMHSRPFTFPEGHAFQTKTVPDTPFTEEQFSH